ncbi:MAG TPA: biotin/lipoyl-binding protein, partial [Methyloceanibacter sp.]|nr:biotin/lipoyl-binding protein [Methyloceanibacter sp.]
MFEDNVLERGEPGLEELDSPQVVPASPHRPSKQEIEAPAHLPPDSPAAERPEWPAQAAEKQPEARGKGRRNGLLHRRPVVLAIGAMLLAAAVGGGDLYLDYAEHFQSTDDAFIAARQSALAPKVSGYITAVPVTDNDHVAAGDVIARIDDRDYRIALDQAEA